MLVNNMLTKNYLLAINKPTGWTSSDVVIKTRNILSKFYNEKVKVGHMGTLDPGAAGVLLVGVNKSTRLFDYMLTKSKSYVGRLTFGKSTDTLDSYGKVIAESDYPTYESVKAVLKDFIGEIEQIPPKYSAIKINGQKAYQMARAEKDFVIPSRKITIYSLKEIKVELDGEYVKSIDLDVTCSSGTYIRTLFVDIAERLNKCGYMAYLIRTSLANISINDSITMDELSNNSGNYRLENIDVIKNIMDLYELNDREFHDVKNGIGINLSINDCYLGLTYQNELKFIGKVENNICKSNTNLE